MLKEISVKNFKSILDDTVSLGRVNVFIGENGVGKSNLLEALMFASLAETYGTIDADSMHNNGIRVAKPSLVSSAFGNKDENVDSTIHINVQFDDAKVDYDLRTDSEDSVLSKWLKVDELITKDVFVEFLKSTTNTPYEKLLELADSIYARDVASPLLSLFTSKVNEYNKLLKSDSSSYQALRNYTIYTLNTEALRGIPEFQHSRKGIHGENLDVIIGQLSEAELEELKEHLYAISWLDDFFIDEKDELKQKGYKLNYSKSLLYFKDRFMNEENNVFSSENSNEGVLHLLFHFANIISSKTPKLFAIDNIETSLNPHLCQHLMAEICQLARKHDKQMLITTHNPAILDGLDLFEDDIHLFEVYRTDNGDTKTRRIRLKPTSPETQQLKLSELWTRGFLGAISDRF